MPPFDRRTVLRAAGGLAGLSVVGTADAASGTTNSTTSTGPRPGPDALYGPNPTPPPLQNASGWCADPLLVSGTDAYVDGEYLYQDYVYDDHGANTVDGPVPPEPAPSDVSAAFSPPTGDVVYPTDTSTYRYNAADLLEFRARPNGDHVTYRFTLQSMVDPEAAGVAVGIDTGSGDQTDWGYGLGDLGAAVDHVLVTWGTGAEFDGDSVDASVDVDRNQIEVDVPLDPGEETWRHYCVVGLFDTDARAFKQIREQPTASEPGGSHGMDVPPVFNVAFRFDEPYGSPNFESGTAQRQLREGLNQLGTRTVGYGNWREHAQAKALADRDISRFAADIDFGKLRRRVTDRHVPDSGYLNLLYPSRYHLSSYERFDANEGVNDADAVFLNPVQPYSAYVPESYDGSPSPLLLFMHSLGAGYNQYGVYSPNVLRELGEANDTIVFTPEARGPSGWYKRAAELAVFEAWRDLETRYAIDRDRVSIGGYSMGGYGTFKLGSQYPDLFGRAFAVVGPAGESMLSAPTDNEVTGWSPYSQDPENEMRIADNLRHLPLLMWNGSDDELVPLPGVLNYERELSDLGYRHELDVFEGYEHLTFALRDQWGPGRAFLDGATVERNPAHVTYRRVPDFDHPQYGLVHDGAYWVSDIAVADDATSGLVDAHSRANGHTDPIPKDFTDQGTDPSAYTARGTTWKRPLTTHPAENAIDLSLTGVTATTLWVERADIDPSNPVTLRVESNHAATVTLAGDFGNQSIRVPSGDSTRTVRLD